MYNGNIGGISGGNIQWNKQLADELDAADGNKDGKISANVWNEFINKSGSKGNKINSFINVNAAMRSLNYYDTTKDKGKIDWKNNWQTLLNNYLGKSDVQKEQSNMDVKNVPLTAEFNADVKENEQAEETQNHEDMEVVHFEHHYRATVKDLTKLRAAGINPSDVNDPNAKAQSVVGDEDGEVNVICGPHTHEIKTPEDECCLLHPKFLEVTDNTNGKKNTYRYRALSFDEIMNGVTNDGHKIKTKQFKHIDKDTGDPYLQDANLYILESVTDENGNDIMKKDHLEVYNMRVNKDTENNTYNYELEQEDGMDGAGQSAIDYAKK